MKPIFTIFFISLFASNYFPQDLPHWMTEEESLRMQSYQYPVNPLFSDPPTSPVRGMAEWEELQGIILTWTSFTSILRQIVDYAQEEGQVFIICSDSNSVKSYLQSGGVPLYNIKYLITSFNSIWVRDYGPWTAYTNDIDTLNIIDWIYNRPRPQDDVTPVFFANYIDAPIYQTTTPPFDLTHTGGNLMVDGHGTAFSSKLILNENLSKTEAQIDEIMNKFLGVDRYIKMNTLPYDVIHHIDMHMKLLDEETLLVGEYPPGVADGPQIEANLQYVLNNFQTCFGRPYKVVRIPMPPEGGQYPPSGDYRTYTNSMIINKTVIIPTYELQYDTTAFRIYREAMPGYNVVGINSNAIIPSLGTIHCIVKEVGVSEPIWISHAKMDSVVLDEDSIAVSAIIKTKSGIADASIFWTTDTTLGFNSSSMQFVSGDSAFGYIPVQIDSTIIYYYISATSNSGRTISKPIVAPFGFYKFIVENSVTNITDKTQPEEFYLYQNYPNPFNPSTKIGFRISDFGFVNLKVYDILGNEVATLVNEEKSAGTYEIEFNATSLPSGVYFYQLKTGSFVETKENAAAKIISMHPKANNYIKQLQLIKHPEGGYFKEVYRSGEIILPEHLPNRYKQSRSFSTSIYFLLEGKQFSAFHLLQSDELWHFYDGSAVLVNIINQKGELTIKKLGRGKNGELQLAIEQQNWFAAEVEDKKSFALFGCTVSPGFEFDDFELGKRDDLIKKFPQHSALIKRLTKSF